MKQDKELVCFCQCGSPEHVFFIKLMDWTNDVHPHFDLEMYLEVHLAPSPFWKRFVNAFRYLFNMSCKDGHFDTVLMRHEEILKLGEVIAEYKKKHDEYDNVV